jgi:uncharacterized protein YfkK (UPF0435 family)
LAPHIEQWKTDYFDNHPQATPDAFYRACHARLRRKILEITEPVNQTAVFENIKVSAGKKKIAADIHKFVMKKKKKGRPVESIIGSAQMLKYMEKFKRLMETCSSEEMDWLTAKYEGCYDFALLLENFAMAIRDGEIKVP